MANYFSFRFQSILNMKEKVEEDKKNQFGLATQKMKKEEENLAVLLKKKEKMINDWKNQSNGVIKVKDLQNISYKMQLIQDLIEQQGKVVQKCKEEINRSRAELIEAKKQKKIFSKLKENDFSQYKYQEKKSEENLVDQLVSYKTANNIGG